MLGVAKRPYFIQLDALARQVTQNFVLVKGAGHAEIDQQLRDRVDALASHAGNGAQAVSLNQATKNAGTIL